VCTHRLTRGVRSWRQGKARLGTVVHKKNATALALTAVKGEDQREFAKLVESVKSMYNDGPRISWGGGIMGVKSQAKAKKKEKQISKELAAGR
jgi:large subunit ribosomal protein L7Ae